MNTEIKIEKDKKTSKPRGRPVAFDQDKALENALHVFWSRGYEGASMSELVEALGINKPSIYAAFGNKEALFQKVLEKYISGPAGFISKALNEPTAKLVAEKFLTGAVEFFSDESHPSGCMVVQGALSCGQGADFIQSELISRRRQLEEHIKNRFDLAIVKGDLPKSANTANLAKYLTTLHQGLSVQATSGASKAELLAVIELALHNWSTVS
ncbi:MAG: TetR/AcrR family transcriptional regulator [Methylotenera sp.]